jgi:NAD+ synthase
MDLTLHAHNAGLEAAEAAEQLSLTPEQVRRAYREIDQKRSTTRYLHLPPLLIRKVKEIKLDTATESD